MAISINEQIKHGEDLLQGHIGELASGYEYIYKCMTNLGNRPFMPDDLEHLATVAPKVARLYSDWKNAIGGDGMHHVIEELESIVW